MSEMIREINYFMDTGSQISLCHGGEHIILFYPHIRKYQFKNVIFYSKKKSHLISNIRYMGVGQEQNLPESPLYFQLCRHRGLSHINLKHKTIILGIRKSANCLTGAFTH